MNPTSNSAHTIWPEAEIFGQQSGQIHFRPRSIMHYPGTCGAYVPGSLKPGTKMKFRGPTIYTVGLGGNLIRS